MNHVEFRDTLEAVRLSCTRAEKWLHLSQDVRPSDLYRTALDALGAPASPPTRAGLDERISRLLATSKQQWRDEDRDAAGAASLAVAASINAIAATARASWPK